MLSRGGEDMAAVGAGDGASLIEPGLGLSSHGLEIGYASHDGEHVVEISRFDAHGHGFRFAERLEDFSIALGLIELREVFCCERAAEERQVVVIDGQGLSGGLALLIDAETDGHIFIV